MEQLWILIPISIIQRSITIRSIVQSINFKFSPNSKFLCVPCAEQSEIMIFAIVQFLKIKPYLRSKSVMYYVDSEILNSIHFGVPQCRERVFFIGIKKGTISKKNLLVNNSSKWFKWPKNKKYKNAITKFDWPTLSKFGENLKKPKDIPLKLCVESCLVPDDKLDSVPNSNEFFLFRVDKNKLRSIKEGETNRPSFKRLHRFRYSPTACYGNNEVHMHPYKNRRLSVREALRIQGVPDTYVLPETESLSKKFKMIGNGVPVPLAKAVANALRNFMINKKITT